MSKKPPEDLAELIRSERLVLITLLEELSPEGWATPSLCEGWTVQHVAAHLAWAPVSSPVTLLGTALRCRFDINETIRRSAVQWGERGRSAILARLRLNAESGVKPLGVPRIAALADAVVHQIDVRRPLGLDRNPPPEAFLALADWFVGVRWPLTMPLGGGPSRRLSGLTLVATDLTWRTGQGPMVRASSETCLAVLAGRPVERARVDGPGADTLARRT